MIENNLTIAVFCNKRDLFLARICVASIRYYYPSIPIELIKDVGNGAFNTKDLENYYKAKLIDFGIEQFGWGASKIHYLANLARGKKVLMLDADIVFTGPFLARLNHYILSYDMVVSGEIVDSPDDPYILETYFDYSQVKFFYPDYHYPGYVFNTGQIFVTGGLVTKTELEPYFDFNQYPFWKRPKLFTMVDQSVLNILIPTLCVKNKLSVCTQNFMVWGMSNEVRELSLDAIKSKTSFDGLIHWAGCIRIPHVSKMSRGDILLFFENHYYENVPLGVFKKFYIRSINFLDFYLRNIYRLTLKKVLKNNLVCSKS